MREAEFDRLHHCSEKDFVRECGFSHNDADAQTVLAIREVLADVGNMRADSICPNQTFRGDLAGLGALDSLDQVDFIMRLEERLGIRIPDEFAEQLRGISDKELYDATFTVRDMVANLVRSLRPLLEARRTHL